MAASVITRTSMTDDSGTGTDGTIINNAWKTQLYDQIDGFFKRTTSGDHALEIENSSNTSGSDCGFITRVGGTSAGDAYASFIIPSGQSWTLGADNSDSDRFKLANSGVLGTTNIFSLSTAGQFMLGTETADANVGAFGLNIRNASGVYVVFKSSGVAHGITTIAETDTFARMFQYDSAAGALGITGFGETTRALVLQGGQTTADTTKSTAGLGAVEISGYAKSGTTLAGVGANGNLVVVTDAGTTRFILDADGDSHQDVGTAWTNFDDYADVDLLHALSAGLSASNDPVRAQFQGLLEQHRDVLTTHRIVTFNKDGHHFVNWSRFHMLMIGAVRQAYARMDVMAGEVAAMRLQLGGRA